MSSALALTSSYAARSKANDIDSTSPGRNSGRMSSSNEGASSAATRRRGYPPADVDRGALTPSLPRSSRRIFVGVIDPPEREIEAPEQVCDRVLEAAEYIPLD